MAKFEIYKDGQGDFRWRLKADNHETIADSAEGYSSKANCEHGVELVKKLAADAEVEEQD